MKKTIGFTIIGITILIILIIFLKPASGSTILKDFDGKIEFHKSMSCGCCGVHADYLKNKGLNFETINLHNVKIL